MKRNVRVFSVVACALFAIVFMGAEKAKPAAKPAAAPVRAKIGVISILTGQGAGYGEAIRTASSSPGTRSTRRAK